VSERFTGVLKFFDKGPTGRGFGFIFRDGSNETIQDFVHISALDSAGINPDSLKEKVTRFSYAMEEDRVKKKRKCADLKILD
jgi:cold shock CspA family protein